MALWSIDPGSICGTDADRFDDACSVMLGIGGRMDSDSPMATDAYGNGQDSK